MPSDWSHENIEHLPSHITHQLRLARIIRQIASFTRVPGLVEEKLVSSGSTMTSGVAERKVMLSTAKNAFSTMRPHHRDVILQVIAEDMLAMIVGLPFEERDKGLSLS